MVDWGMHNYIMDMIHQQGSEWVCVVPDRMMIDLIPHAVGDIAILSMWHFREDLTGGTIVFVNRYSNMFFTFPRWEKKGDYNSIFLPKFLFTDKELFLMRMAGSPDRIDWESKLSYMNGIYEWYERMGYMNDKIE